MIMIIMTIVIVITLFELIDIIVALVYSKKPEKLDNKLVETEKIIQKISENIDKINELDNKSIGKREDNQ